MHIALSILLSMSAYIAYIDISYYFNFGANISPHQLPQYISSKESIDYKGKTIEKNTSKFIFSPVNIYHEESYNGISIFTGYNESSPFFYKKRSYYDLDLNIRDTKYYSFVVQIDTSGNVNNEINLTVHQNIGLTNG